jgi:hypothetical protein
MFHLPRLLLLLPLAGALHAATPAGERFQGGKIEWARLQTKSPYWNRHSEFEGSMLSRMRTHTSLNIDRNWRSVTALRVEDLCRFPFIYAESIMALSTVEAANLAEYLRRGGFLLIDACINVGVTPNPESFLRGHIKLLTQKFPDLRVATLPPEHEVFSIMFHMRECPPQTRTPGRNNWANGPTLPLRGIYSGDRMIGMISLNGYQCGWAGFGGPQTADECIQMLTNIYVYAMTR